MGLSLMTPTLQDWACLYVIHVSQVFTVACLFILIRSARTLIPSSVLLAVFSGQQEYTPCSYPFTPPTPASYHCPVYLRLFTGRAVNSGVARGPSSLIPCHILRVQQHHVGGGLAECLLID